MSVCFERYFAKGYRLFVLDQADHDVENLVIYECLKAGSVLETTSTQSLQANFTCEQYFLK